MEDLVRAVLTHRRLVVSIVVLAVVIGLLIALLSTPVYRADVLLSPVTSAAPGALSIIPGEFAELARSAGLESHDQERQEALAVLQSRDFTMRFIRDEKLMPVLFADEWNEEDKSWRAKASGDTPTLWMGYEFFDRAVRFVYVDKVTGLVTLSTEWTDPALASKWANALVRRVNAHLQTRAVEESERSLGFLREELERTRVAEVREVVYRLIESQMQRAMIANVRDESGFRVLDPAVTPEQRVRPRRKLVVVVSLVLGSLAALGAALWADARSGRRPAASESA